jgi:hypothetical protein
MKNGRLLEQIMKEVDQKAMYGDTSKHYFQWIKGNATIVFYVEDQMKWVLDKCSGDPQKVKEEIRKLFRNMEDIVFQELNLEELISKRNVISPKPPR